MLCLLCKKRIALGESLRCTGCKKGFHYSCVNITSAVFMEKKNELESKFKCDSCLNITNRVRVTDETPVRGVSTGANIINYEEEYNMPSIIEMMKEVMTEKFKIFEERIISEFKRSLSSLAHENSKLREELRVANSKCISLSEEIKVLKINSGKPLHVANGTKQGTNYNENIAIDRNPPPQPPRAPPAPRSSYAVPTAPYHTQHVDCEPLPMLPSQPAQVPPITTYATVARSTVITENNDSINNKWMEVNNMKRNNPIKRGGNKSTLLLKAVERKKFLHVWRLDKSTTEDSLNEYIRNVLGNDIDLKIHKIIPRIEKDYASFKIGLSEENYEKLSHPDIWPVNVEFSEWIWFRRSPASEKESQST